MKNTTEVPMIENYFYNSRSVVEIIDKYCRDLKSTSDPTCIAHSVQLENYKATAINENHLYHIRTLFNKTFKMLYDEVDFCFTFEARRKSLLSTEAKLLKLIKEKQSIDLIRDFLGFRIIIFSEKTKISQIYDLYKLAEKLVVFYANNGYILCDAAASKDNAEFDKNKYKDIILPNEKTVNAILKNCLYGVKDYVLHPKKNGYQSLHMVFKGPKGRYFEVQLRTFDQHIWAEADCASHSTYKKKRYDELEVNYSKMKIPGLAKVGNEIIDCVGFSKSLLIYHRQKTVNYPKNNFKK